MGNAIRPPVRSPWSQLEGVEDGIIHLPRGAHTVGGKTPSPFVRWLFRRRELTAPQTLSCRPSHYGRHGQHTAYNLNKGTVWLLPSGTHCQRMPRRVLSAIDAGDTECPASSLCDLGISQSNHVPRAPVSHDQSDGTERYLLLNQSAKSAKPNLTSDYLNSLVT